MEQTNSTNIKELREATGWTIEKLVDEAGASRSTLYRMMKDLTGKPAANNPVSMSIMRLHRKHIPPLLADLQSIADDVHTMQGVLNSTQYESYLLSQFTLVKVSLSHKITDNAQFAIFYYLAGLIGYQLRYAVKSRNKATPTRKKIIQNYKSAANYLPDEPAYQVLASKLSATAEIIDFMGRDSKTRSRDRDQIEKIKKLLSTSKFFLHLRRILEAEPWFWKAARNGLVAASVIQDENFCKYYWAKLKEADPAFKDSEYAPDKFLKSVTEDPDTWWFATEVLPTCSD